MSLIQPKHRCYCGSDYCGPFQCRFYKSEQEAKEQQDEFYKQWAVMESRDNEQA